VGWIILVQSPPFGAATGLTGPLLFAAELLAFSELQAVPNSKAVSATILTTGFIV
jgi:hypothetical protein